MDITKKLFRSHYATDLLFFSGKSSRFGLGLGVCSIRSGGRANYAISLRLSGWLRPFRV